MRYSSQSPTGKNPPEHFNKTGEKEQDPVDVVMGSREYSQSGGDDVVAQQDSASFKVRNVLSRCLIFVYGVTVYMAQSSGEMVGGMEEVRWRADRVVELERHGSCIAESYGW